MTKVTMEIETEPTQVEALRVYLDRKGTYLEFEIAQYVESLYKKTVPDKVRDYISATIKMNKEREEVYGNSDD